MRQRGLIPHGGPVWFEVSLVRGTGTERLQFPHPFHLRIFHAFADADLFGWRRLHMKSPGVTIVMKICQTLFAGYILRGGGTPQSNEISAKTRNVGPLKYTLAVWSPGPTERLACGTSNPEALHIDYCVP